MKKVEWKAPETAVDTKPQAQINSPHNASYLKHMKEQKRLTLVVTEALLREGFNFTLERDANERNEVVVSSNEATVFITIE